MKAQQPILGNTFVTGATGLLGSELVRQLLDAQESSRIVCLVRDWVPHSRFFHDRMDEKTIIVNGDIRDQDLLDRTLNEYEIRTVFHLAAQTLVGQANTRPTETLDVNIRGTWALLEAVRLNGSCVEATVIASSDKAYGNLHGDKYDEKCPLAGSHPYDVSKSCADLISHTYAHSFGMNTAVTRCGNFFGPGDLNNSRIFPHTILSFLKHQAPVIRSNGHFVRDYIYVGDGASAYRSLAKQMFGGQFRGEAFNFSYGLRLTVLDVVAAVAKVMGVDIEPHILNQAHNEIPVQCLDSTKARELLQWKPELGFEAGIEKTVDWYRSAVASGLIG
jgi:CDP-glucose 4,6-dehydratase